MNVDVATVKLTFSVVSSLNVIYSKNLITLGILADLFTFLQFPRLWLL